MTGDSHVLAMHQPNYLPWLGYFHKMAHSDSFVFLDSVQYPRGRSFSARNRIKTANGVSFLTIPVRIPEGRMGKVRYDEVGFVNDAWKSKHLKTIERSYKRAPHFSEVFQLLQDQLLRKAGFVDLNIGLIKAIAAYLGIQSKCLRLSELMQSHSNKTDLIVEICKTVGANTYLSGTGGGKAYTEEGILIKNGIQLIFNEFNHPAYPQLGSEFVTDLSVIDILFNLGPGTRTHLA